MPSDSHVQVDAQTSAPFEGPEKLLEIWFAPSASDVAHIGGPDGKVGLRAVPKQIWEDMLQIVKCKVLSVIEGTEMDAYLLRSVLPQHLIFCSFCVLKIVNHLSSCRPTVSSSKRAEQPSTCSACLG